MYLKSINHVKDGWKATIWTDETKYIRQIILECDNLEGLVEQMKIWMYRYRQDNMAKGWSSEEVNKELSPLDF